MRSDAGRYSLPRWRVMQWLTDVGPDVPADIRAALIAQLFGAVPIFAGGAINSVAIAAIIAYRQQTAPLIAWFVLELVICLARLAILLAAHRAIRLHQPTPTDLHLLFSMAWSLSLGLGAMASIASGDWLVAMLACMSTAAMIGGICFRNFGAPRFAGLMILISLGPLVLYIALLGEPVLYIMIYQIPMYLAAMTGAAFRLNRMLITTMQAERENSRRAHHDALTGLLNRAGFVDGLEAKLAQSIRENRSFALFFSDLDAFKPINDTFGHAAGDQVLKVVAERLRKAVPEGAAIARMGGDEFVALVDGVTADQALAMGQRIVDEIAAPYQIDGETPVTIGASVGIALAPDHGSQVDELLVVADRALYEAKSDGKSRCCLAGLDIGLTALRQLQHSGRRPANATSVAA
ncbi:GGDEF domain-containing protein [Bradyrhizobium symbiodeficiens]|uniref:GGDEF domain-containing protein n=1 Tax=Bradyrhizobium symbiodeficiens TaxID=1404367 RepID=A0ABX5WII1_9BRAD|nr:GGDEF domain-containing protein [Bradyrhizobium symbiodeficiens]